MRNSSFEDQARFEDRARFAEAGRHASSGNFLDDLNTAVRENPVAAGLIGMGALWMVVGGSRMSALGHQLPGAAQSIGRAAASAGAAGTRAVSDGLGSVGSRLGQAAQHIGDAVSSGASSVRDAAASSYDTVASSASKVFDGGQNGAGEQSNGAGIVDRSSAAGRQFATSMQKNLSEALDRQPLLLGVLGLAFGVGVASVFATTEAERKLMGEKGAAVKENLKTMAHNAVNAASTRVERIVEDVAQEAGDQSLTPAAAKEQFEDVAEKVAKVASAAGESVKSRLR